MPQAECENLLLHFLERQFVVIPHSNVFFHLLILFARNMDRAVGMVSQTTSNVRCISLIGFDFFLPSWLWHRSWSQNDTIHPIVG